MSMLIPKQWEHKMSFMLEARKAFATTISVFNFFDCEPRRADVLDYGGFVDTMVALCRKHRRDRSGIEDMQTTIALSDSYQESVRLHRVLEDDEFRGLHCQNPPSRNRCSAGCACRMSRAVFLF